MKISQTEFTGSKAVEIKTDGLELVVVTDCGPRIAYLGKPGGQNLFLWEPGEHARGSWDLRGGHRVWATTPGADECEDTYAPDNAPCDIEIRNNSLVVTGAESPVNRTRRGMKITILDDNTLEVDNYLINTGELLYSGGVWGLTCSPPKENSRYVIPVGDASSWDVFTVVNFRKWADHGEGGFDDPQFSVQENLFVLEPQGRENKRMVQSHRGIVAMSNPVDKVTFAKKTDYDPAGQYPLNTNMALYVGPGNFMVEMETMGPEKTLKPGDVLHHRETWKLRDGATPLRDSGEVEALFDA